MNYRRLVKLLYEIFISDFLWFIGVLAGITGIVGFLVSKYISNWDVTITMRLFFELVMISFLFKLFKLIYRLYDKIDNRFQPLKAISLLSGEGGLKGRDIITFDRVYNVLHGTVITLYCGSSGANQAICLLRVIPSAAEEKLIAIREFPNDPDFDLSIYFNDRARREKLFAIPLYNVNELELLQGK